MRSGDLLHIVNRMGLGPSRVEGFDVKGICPDRQLYHDTSSESSGRSFSVSIAEGSPSIYNCFVCSRRGLFISLIREFINNGRLKMDKEEFGVLEKEEGLDFEGRIDYKIKKLDTAIANKLQYGEFIPYRESKDFGVEESSWDSFTKDYGASDYAKSRGISEKTWSALDMRYDINGGRLAQAIRRRSDNKIVTIVGRALHDDVVPRHMPYFGGPKLWIYREHEVFDDAVLFEGPLKAALAYEKGVLNSISLQGAKFSKNQLDFLKNYDTITICMDTDDAGEEATHKLVKGLKDYVNLYVLDLQPGEEFEELGKQKIKEILDNKIMVMSENYKKDIEMWKMFRHL